MSISIRLSQSSEGVILLGEQKQIPRAGQGTYQRRIRSGVALISSWRTVS